MSDRRAAILVLTSTLAIGCARTRWPDEPGVPIELIRFQNVDAEERFLTAITARRRASGFGEPLVAPRYQTELRALAEKLQAGHISAPAAERAAGVWARAAYGREVSTYAVDCSSGVMSLPAPLAEAPFLAIAYAAAHFRPRSLASGQCAILAVAVAGSETVAPLRF